ncbi:MULTISPECIES: DUF6942 family protein [Pseudoalteromonas]|uniref:Orphan protein n=1 Tax=Pseudoalteromonas haloplanktis TaxID=228 RepID=A0ABU1B9S0_PSEHA|nr:MULTISPECIES: hypothetical protein [Pseudoalteromonas]MCF6146301.1 hypothetical protein [Pseudoalteromonas mariniglutinosa NCIMB 1770]MDQ9090254.1 hypothetical protein [Pseudoalteromonas haloplanktis]TMN71718.1 hypothetical protein CWB85_09835 [Pseudoalteromonas sp. S1727]
MTEQFIGFGEQPFKVAVYIANTPPMAEYNDLCTLSPLATGQINTINQACGNGWRKVFNVYAKVLFALPSEFYQFAKLAPTWQQYRDTHLLQSNSQTALLFSPPQLINSTTLHIIAGRTYAKALISQGLLTAQLQWLDEEFAIDRANKLIVCPYFDYRQLSNIKIARLSQLVAECF